MDQKRTDEMVNLMDEVSEKYVPYHNPADDMKPLKIVAFADYLGFERQKSAQMQVEDGRTPSERLEGLVSAMSDFHTQAEWHKVRSLANKNK